MVVGTIPFLIGAAIAALLVLSVVLLSFWWAVKGDCRRQGLLLVALGVALLVVASRSIEMRDRVSWAPYLDEYEGELASVIGPYRAGKLHWSDFFAAHNDHRIATTRATSLFAYLLNGEWDNRVLAVLGYALQGMAFALFAALALRALGAFPGTLAALATVWPAFVICDWENLVVGFQLQFHFLVLSSLIAITLTGSSSRLTFKAILGVAAAIFASLSIGSGFSVFLAMGFGLLLRSRVEGKLSMATMGLLSICFIASVVGWYAKPVFHAHDFLRANDARGFFRALWCYGSWPLAPTWWCFMLLWMPWSVIVAKAVFRKSATDFDLIVAATGAWILLQIVALSIARAGYVPAVGARYAGILEWSGVVAAAALGAFASNARHKSRSTLSAILVLGCALVVSSLTWRSQTFYRPFLADFVQQTREHERRLREFMRTDDERVFTSVQFPHIPYPTVPRLMGLLRDPAIREALPAPLRREAVRGHAGNVEQIEAGPLTWLSRLALRSGLAFVTLSFVALAWGILALCAAGNRGVADRYKPH